MKKVNFNSKLQLKKEIVANLNSEQMTILRGGVSEQCTEFAKTFKCGFHVLVTAHCLTTDLLKESAVCSITCKCAEN